MGRRTGTVLGTDRGENLGEGYVDANGNSVTMFSNDDRRQTSSDNIIVQAGGGNDRLVITQRYTGSDIADNIRADGGDGNDRLQVTNGSWLLEGEIVLNGGAGNDTLNAAGMSLATLDGGAGDDYISTADAATGEGVWKTVGYGESYTMTLTGGSGADEFYIPTAANYEVTHVITDFELGVDTMSIGLTDQYTDPKQPVVVGADMLDREEVVITDTADGLQIEIDEFVVTSFGPLRYWAVTNTILLQGLTLDDVADNIVEGTDGDDVIRGSYRDADAERLTAGSDVILAGAGNDYIALGSVTGVDRAYGQDGDDTIRSNDGNNRLYGGDGDDYLVAMRGESTLEGGAGDDLLVAATYDGSDHRLYGGEGADTFHIISRLTEGSSTIEITLFDLEEDSLIVRGQLIDLYNLPDSITAWQGEYNESLRLDIGDGETLLMVGLDLRDLSPA